MELNIVKEQCSMACSASLQVTVVLLVSVFQIAL